MSDSASLKIGDKESGYPIRSGTIGPDVIDIRKLYAETGCFTYDPGFTSTASCDSALTYIDGDEGVLLHRGYPIGELAEDSSFMEVSYLLLNGELPSKDELDSFTYTISRHTMLHEQLMQFYRGFRRDAHPMAIMCGVVGALSAFYHDSTDIADPDHRRISSHRLIAKMPTIAAAAGHHRRGGDVGVSATAATRVRTVGPGGSTDIRCADMAAPVAPASVGAVAIETGLATAYSNAGATPGSSAPAPVPWPPMCSAVRRKARSNSMRLPSAMCGYVHSCGRYTVRRPPSHRQRLGCRLRNACCL